LSKLFVKVDSDIRSGLGCKGDKRIKTVISYNRTGERKSEGSVTVVAEHTGDQAVMGISARGSDGHMIHIAIITIDKEGVRIS
jgi:hypothetical protein